MVIASSTRSGARLYFANFSYAWQSGNAKLIAAQAERFATRLAWIPLADVSTLCFIYFIFLIFYSIKYFYYFILCILHRLRTRFARA